VPVSPETLQEIALSPQEYQRIIDRLDREPNPVELGLFGALWSEHCGYKHSRPLLGLLPSDSPRLVVAPGVENAGVVDVGGGLAVVMKIESHNHPSAVEPFQGAATGVGGIVRDILTMGARPIALLNSLRFGPPTSPRQRHLLQSVVAGISWYGNCIGVPDVGGEVCFSPSYAENPLVNAMCVGLVPVDRLVRGVASGPGDLLLLVGADTGRDGIHGASGLASRTFEEERELRTTVQVGNPFMEKVLIEACLEALERHPEAIAGMQDLGAAGLTSSVVECADRSGAGVWVDVARVPRRETGMTPYEVLLSESQERMLLIIRPGGEREVQALFDRWDLTSEVIGEITGDDLVRIYDGDDLVASVPVRHLMDPPQYRSHTTKPPELEAVQGVDLGASPPPDDPAAQALLRLLASPNIASRAGIYRQYDHQVQAATVLAPGAADAAVLLLRGTGRAIALTTDGNGRITSLDPFVGGALAVAEACRNLSCVGAEPIAVTDCLNFGDPERPEVSYQLEEAIKGIAEACRVLGVPVVSGNVSLYNESRGQAVYPTPVLGALGVLDDVTRHCGAGFQQPGDVVVLLGASEVTGDAATLAGSEAQELLQGTVAGRPAIDLELEARVQRLCRAMVAHGLLSSAHDCSEGGLAVALAESCILGRLGAVVEAEASGRWDAALFGEAPSRIVVSLSHDGLATLESMAARERAPTVVLGRVGGERLIVSGLVDLPLTELEGAWRSGLSDALGGR
jgi:phosphoribosylformylglycinamidine synthase